MLRIRLQRTGRKNLAAYRIVVAEKHRAVKKKVVEVIGHYIPTRDPKIFEIKTDRLEHWISKGAMPTDTVASLCKRQGIKDMDKFIDARNKKGKKKKETPEDETPKATPAAEEKPAVEEAPKAVETPAPEEKPAVEEAPKAVETPASEEKPAVEEAPKAEETPAK